MKSDRKNGTSGVSRSAKITQTLLLSTSYFTFGVVYAQEGVVFLDLVAITNSDITRGAFMLTASSIGYMLGVLIIGPLYDRFNNDFLLCMSLLGTGVITVIIPWCSYLPLMIVLFGLKSFCAGPADPGSCAFCVKIWRHTAGPVLHTLLFLWSVGAAITPFITEPFLLTIKLHNLTKESHEIVPLFINKTITSFLNSIDEYGNIPRDSPKNTSLNNSSMDKGNKDMESQVYKAFAITGAMMLVICLLLLVKATVFSSGEFDHFAQTGQTPKETKRPNHVASFSISKKVICYLLIGIISFSYGCALKMLTGFLMAFVVEYLGWSKTDGSLAATLFWAGFSGCRFLGIFMSKLLKPSTLLFVLLFGLLICAGVMLLVECLSWNRVLWWGIIVLAGTMLGPRSASQLAWLDTTLMPVTGKLVSYIYVWVFVGSMSQSALLGYLFENIAPLWFVYLLLIDSSLACMSFLALYVAAGRFQHNATSEIVVHISSPSSEEQEFGEFPHLEENNRANLNIQAVKLSTDYDSP